VAAHNGARHRRGVATQDGDIPPPPNAVGNVALSVATMEARDGGLTRQPQAIAIARPEAGRA